MEGYRTLLSFRLYKEEQIKQLAHFEGVFERIIDKFDPPFTKEKLDSLIKNPDSIEDVLQAYKANHENRKPRLIK